MRNNIRNIMILGGLILSMPLSSQDALDRYLQVAAENNPGLQSRFNEYLAALETVPQAGALPDPRIAFGYFIQPVETRVGPQQFRFSASQMFPWFGTLNARENKAAKHAKSKYEAFEEAKSSLFHEVRSMYFNIYHNRKALEIVEENIRILGSFRQLALIKVESGTVSPLDEYRITMEIGDLENQWALLKDERATLEIAFFNLLNISSEEILVPDVLWTAGPLLAKEALRDSIMKKNHRLLQLERQQEALASGREVARKAGLPSFSLGLDYINIGAGVNGSDGKDAVMFPSIGISIPLYRDKYNAMVQELTLLETAKSLEKDENRNQLETLFENTWKELQDAGRRIDLFEKQLELADQSIELLEVEYTTDHVNFEEILRMERKRLQYALELERARADKQAAISFLDRLMGG